MQHYKDTAVKLQNRKIYQINTKTMEKVQNADCTKYILYKILHYQDVSELYQDTMFIQ